MFSSSASAAEGGGSRHEPRLAVTGRVGYVFAVLLVINTAVNFDAGNTAAALVQLSHGCPDEESRTLGKPPQATVMEFDPHYPCLNRLFKGYLCAMTFVGEACASPFTGLLLVGRRARPVLLGFSLIAGTATAVFASSIVLQVMLIAKFFMGAFYSAAVIYCPVWISVFAPERYKGRWLAANSSAPAIGNLIGYSLVGYLDRSGVSYQWGWRFQAMVVFVSCAALCMAPPHNLIISAPQRTRDGLTTWAPAVARICRRPLYVFSTLCMMLCFAVASCAQFWTQEFLLHVFSRDRVEVTHVMACVFATSPVLGVVVGGVMTDKMGGAGSPDQIVRTCLITLVWGSIAALAGCMAVSVDPMLGSDTAEVRFRVAIGGIWVQIFGLAACFPGTLALSLGAISESERTISQSVTNLVCNIFGYGLGAFMPGALSERYGLQNSMRVCFSWTWIACVLMFACFLLSRREVTKHRALALEAASSEVELSTSALT